MSLLYTSSSVIRAVTLSAVQMHVVSYDEEHYNDVSEAAAAKGNGLAVLSVLFHVSTNTGSRNMFTLLNERNNK